MADILAVIQTGKEHIEGRDKFNYFMWGEMLFYFNIILPIHIKCTSVLCFQNIQSKCIVLGQTMKLGHYHKETDKHYS